MFKRISSIRDFGVFNSFTGSILPDFPLFNVIYGWNYSGKTTLSRLFRSLEIGKLHPDYSHARFEILNSDDTQHDHTFTTPCNIRVYNEDFRKEHLFWDETDGFRPILILGAENISRQKELEEKEESRNKTDEEYKSFVSEMQSIDDKISRAETECARQIVKELPVGRFDRRNLRPIISAWNGILPAPLNATEIQEERAKVTAEQKDELPNFYINIDSITKLWRNSVDLLTKQLGIVATIPYLVDHPDIAVWVERGRQLHEGKTHCEFCEGRIHPDRAAALNAHFSDAFEHLKKEIETAINDLAIRRVDFSGNAYVKSAFYPDLHEEHAIASQALRQARETFNGDLNKLIEALRKKFDNPFTVISTPTTTPDLTPLLNAIQRFQKLIDTNNGRTRRFTSLRAKAITTLTNHYTAEAMRRVNRFVLQEQKAVQEVAAQKKLNELTALNAEISALQVELSNAVQGAEAINDTLRRFFGKTDIQVKVTSEDRFLLMRGQIPARNLSEGERTAIAFCYFITKLFENGNKLSQTIVYIDDPISSLDAHHLLHVSAFIRNIFYRRNEAAPRHECLAKQIFISTHNHDFFSLMLDWVKKMPQSTARSWMIERTESNGHATSRLIECPESIRKYRSEYLFLFQKIFEYSKNPQSGHQEIFNIGNMTRRFIEGYSSFKYMEHSNIDSSIDRLIVDPVDAERARKFMHFYSHTLTRSGGMFFPDMSEAQAVVNLILEAVKSQDSIHYYALLDAH